MEIFYSRHTFFMTIYITLKKHQRTLTFATVSKVSDIENEWWLMGILYFESFLRNK